MNLVIMYLLLVVKKCGRISNNIDDLNAQICVPDKLKKLNVKLLNVKCKWNEFFSSAWIVWV